MNKEFYLEVWRLHPKGSRIKKAEKTLHGTANKSGVSFCKPYSDSNSLGWWLFPAVNVNILWKGGKEFEHQLLEDWPHTEHSLVKSLVVPSDKVNSEEFAPPDGRSKFTFGAVEDGVVQMWTGCVKKGTRIITSAGYNKIENGCFNVLTERGEQKCESVICQGTKKIYKIKTVYGGICVSQDHRFLVYDGKLKWKEAKNINNGDSLLRVRGNSNIIPKNSGGCVDLYFSLGYLFGDGSCLETNVLTWIFAEKDVEAKERVISYLDNEKIHWWECSKICKNEKIDYLSIGRHNQIRSYLPPYLPKGEWRKNGLPEFVWKLGQDQLNAFIRGLFTADGSIRTDKGGIEFYTKYRKVAKDLQQLLLCLGVVSAVSWRAKKTFAPKGITKSYCVRLIGTKSHDIFSQTIGFQSLKKMDKINGKNRKRNRYDRNIGIPHATKILTSIFNSNIGSKHNHKGLDKVISETIRRIKIGKSDFLPESMIQHVINRAITIGCKSKELQFLKDYCSNNWWFDTVTKISDVGEGLVYDVVNVDKTNSYVAEGFVSHNCIFKTPPGWCLQIRSPINVHNPDYFVMEGILETDWMQYDIWTNIVFKTPNKWIELRKDSWPPLAQLVPIRRESSDAPWENTVDEIVHRKTVEANSVFEYWIQYNKKKFGIGGKGKAYLGEGRTKDAATFWKERAIVLDKESYEPKLAESKPLPKNEKKITKKFIKVSPPTTTS